MVAKNVGDAGICTRFCGFVAVNDDVALWGCEVLRAGKMNKMLQQSRYILAVFKPPALDRISVRTMSMPVNKAH